MFTSGEWASKVNSIAPLLNMQGLHRALAILDQANFNVQRAKAFKEGMTGAHPVMGYTGMPHLQYAMTCAMLEAQVHTEQQQLLNELQQLPYDPFSVRPDLLPSPAAVHQLQECNPPCVELSPSTPMSVTGVTPKAAMQQETVCENPKASTRRVQTLSTSLQLLSGESPDCLFIVRRINKLGFKAVRILKRHFSAYGAVTKVLLAHSTVRQHGDPSCNSRRRPSSLGFVHMSNTDAVRKVLALGNEQEVEGHLIRVQRFERQYADEIDEENEGEFDRCISEATTTSVFTRCTSDASTKCGSSSASTKTATTTESD
jgi:hypothetical protein